MRRDGENTAEEGKTLDPVCGMVVEAPSGALSYEHEDRRHYFCSRHCLQKFKSDPGQFIGEKAEPEPPSAHQPVPNKAITYTCPMHPEVVRDTPGDCPKCGMALEPRTPVAEKAKAEWTCPMHPRRMIKSFLGCSGFCAAAFVLVVVLAQPVCAQERKADARAGLSLWKGPIEFFQKVISKADGDRCVMYPSCSQYAAEAFQRYGALKGWILASDRLLRGGHDEVRLSPKVRVNGRRLTYDPVEANTRWWNKP